MIVKVGDEYYRLDGWVRYQTAVDANGAPVGYDVWFPAGARLKGECRAELRGEAAQKFAAIIKEQQVIEGTPEPGTLQSGQNLFDDDRG